MTCEDFTNFGLHLCTRVDLNERQLYRLVGIGLSNFEVEGDVEPEALLSDSLRPGSITVEAQDVG